MNVGGRLAVAILVNENRITLAIADAHVLSFGLAIDNQPGVGRIGLREFLARRQPRP